MVREPADALVGTREDALERARFAATVLDESIRVPGTDFRVGLDPVLGVVPGGGDAAAAAASLYVVAEAVNAGAPLRTVAGMLARVGVDTAFGSIPVAGELFDAFWKANKWNVDALERHVERTSEPVTHIPVESPEP